jgi:hypothetical protein
LQQLIAAGKYDAAKIEELHIAEGRRRVCGFTCVLWPSTPEMKSPTANAPLTEGVSVNRNGCRANTMVCSTFTHKHTWAEPSHREKSGGSEARAINTLNTPKTMITAHLHAAACDGRQHEADTALHRRGGCFGRGDWLGFLLGDGSARSLLGGLCLNNWGTRVHGGFDRLGGCLCLGGIGHGYIAETNRRARDAHDDKRVLALSLRWLSSASTEALCIKRHLHSEGNDAAGRADDERPNTRHGPRVYVHIVDLLQHVASAH